MIDLIIKDGLGNQMFQYAFARCLQQIYKNKGINETLIINPYFIRNNIVADTDNRYMSIQHFKLNNSIIFAGSKYQKMLYYLFKLQILFATDVRRLYLWRIKHQKDDSEDLYLHRTKRGVFYTYGAYSQYPVMLPKCKYKHIFGYFQSEYNFKPVADIIKEEFIVKDEPSEDNRKMLLQIHSCNSVCLHIRRGDYLNNRWRNLRICDFDYYKKAMNYILQKVDNPTFFVFSNTHEDIEWIKGNYHFGDNVDLVYVDLSNPDYEELRLMSSCKHLIISNSTFSWWGAYLCNNPNKIVVAPPRWNLASDNDWMIYQKEWIKIY